MRVETIDKPKTRYIPASASVALFPATTVSCSLLSQFQPQDKAGSEAKPLVNENKGVRAIGGAFRTFETAYHALMAKPVSYGTQPWFPLMDAVYFESLKTTQALKPSARDIELFSIGLVKFQEIPDFNYISGIFLSALVNSSEDSDFSIRTKDLSRTLQFLGFKNTKNMVVHGSVGDHFGCDMVRGRVEVNGNAGHYFGVKMVGGSQILNGNVIGGWLGDNMNAGNITVYGNIRDLSEHVLGGNIFQRGRQLVKDGEEIDIIENK